MPDRHGEMPARNAPRHSIGARPNPASADAIRAAAEEILAEKGYGGFSIEAVARRARAGKPTVYRWWPSKAALLLDVYHRQKRLPTPDTGSLEEDVYRFLRGLLDQWRETPSGTIFRSILAEAQSDEKSAAALAAYAGDRRQHTGRMIARAQERGEAAASIDPLVAADLIMACAWTHLMTGRTDASDAEIRAAARHLVGNWLVVKGPA